MAKLFFYLLLLPWAISAFAPSRVASTSSLHKNSMPIATNPSIPFQTRENRQLFMAENPEDDGQTCWEPQLRRIVGSMASLGILETAYLTYAKLTGGSEALCGPDGGCNSVLSGPYASIPFTEIPLASLGLVAYSIVALLALQPLVSKSDDTENRIWLTAATTTMGTFSAFLMSILFGVLHTSCPYCILSAALSLGMAGIVWIGGGLPDEERKRGMQVSAGGFATSVLAAFVLFFSVDGTDTTTQFAGSSNGNSQTLLASTEGLKPPPISTSSTERSLTLATKLNELDAKMYGAYWCSHCYDQKETFGKEAFSKIPYIECSKDGYNQKNSMCKEAGVPGYPTWSIQGKLYPGEQSLDELEEIVQQAKK